MEMLIIILLLFFFLAYSLVVFFFLRRSLNTNNSVDRQEFQQKLDTISELLLNNNSQNRQEIQQKIELLSAQLLQDKSENLQTIQKLSQHSALIIKEVTEKLTKIDETNKQVLGFSEKLQSLENVLKNPKQRGILGEYFLETLLGNVLQPNQYKMQYAFNNGEIVDAVIFYKEKIIPIDAKFSLEKYNKIMEETNQATREQLEKDFRNDIKNRIDETSKYIRPGENTTDFAFMFIPAEGVYYSLLSYKVGANNLSQKDLIEYAFGKHVIIVSPVSFFAYLETVLQGLRAQKMEENVNEILKRVAELGKHIVIYDDFMKKVGKNLSLTVSSYNNAYKEFKKIDKDVVKLTDGAAGGSIEPDLLDRPQEE